MMIVSLHLKVTGKAKRVNLYNFHIILNLILESLCQNMLKIAMVTLN